MALIPVLFVLLSFLLFANESTSVKNNSNIISVGSSLSPIAKGDLDLSSWASSSGHFAFGFYPQGDGLAVGIWLVGNGVPENNTIVWTANRDLPPVSSDSTLNFTSSGLLLIQKGKKDTEVLTITNDSKPLVATSASMLDSGNFVLYDKDFHVIAQSFDRPTDTIIGGQNLTIWDQLVSSKSRSDHSSGHFYLAMQEDSNLVAYPVNSSAQPMDAYWDTKTSGKCFKQLSLNHEGFLCLNCNETEFHCFANSTNNLRKIKSHTNTTSIYRATIEVDGNIKLYVHQFEGNSNTSSSVQILWTALTDECQINGFCGFNSYCSNMSGFAVCNCYPGFVASKYSAGKMFLDCKKNCSKDDCESSADPKELYHLVSLENMQWGHPPYSAGLMKIDTCRKSCREDCDCAAVIYTSGKCYKYKLPLIYGRKVENASGSSLLKVLSGDVTSPNSTLLSQMKPKVLVDNKRSLIMILAYSLGSVSLFCLVFAVYVFTIYRGQVYRYKMLSASASLGFTEQGLLRSFSFDELVTATGGFTEEIGRGSFGAVYKGTISGSNRRIAVKRLEKIDEGEREFRAEIAAIARTHHRNLVQLIGFCIDGSRKLLVYEYLSNGSLADVLFKGNMCLSWKEKIKIALDVARGVLYLHEECEVRIIHCNIKPRNIVMDENWTPKISDFGLARLMKPEHSRCNKEDEGESWYLAPEWQKEASSVSVKADIYSYGMVLLEIVCRRSRIKVDVSLAEEILLSSWVYQCFEAGDLHKLLANDEDSEEVADWRIIERMVKVGLWCVQDDPSLRPSMKNVILMLEGLKDIPIPPSPAHMNK